jgi:putative ABC transport system substrate-binding protein
MRRRDLLLASAALAAAPLAARAQKRLPVLGILLPEPRPAPEAWAERVAKSPLRARLRELGWVDGKTFHIETLFGGPNLEGLSEAATALVAKKVDVLWTQGYLATIAAARATKSIPIVFWLAGYVIEAGLVDSFARPGRNVTGLAWFADYRAFLKPAELLRDIAPKARRMAVLQAQQALPTVAGGTVDLTAVRGEVAAALQKAGFEIERFWMANEADLEPSLAAIEKWSPDCLRVGEVPLTRRFTKQIVEFARRQRLADAHDTRLWVETGGLVSYGTNVLPTLPRSAEMLDRILRGAKPAEMPVELPTTYDIAVNLKTARSLGLTVPQSVLLRADRVIE